MNKYQNALDKIGEFAYECDIYDEINTLQELINVYNNLLEMFSEGEG